MGLYHKDHPDGWPKPLKLPSMVVRPEIRGHARDRVRQKVPNGMQSVHRELAVYPGNIFEVETSNGKVTKVGVREYLDGKDDIVYIILVPSGHVKTVYLNASPDKHSTLDLSKYDDPTDLSKF